MNAASKHEQGTVDLAFWVRSLGWRSGSRCLVLYLHSKVVHEYDHPLFTVDPAVTLTFKAIALTPTLPSLSKYGFIPLMKSRVWKKTFTSFQQQLNNTDVWPRTWQLHSIPILVLNNHLISVTICFTFLGSTCCHLERLLQKPCVHCTSSCSTSHRLFELQMWNGCFHSCSATTAKPVYGPVCLARLGVHTLGSALALYSWHRSSQGQLTWQWQVNTDNCSIWLGNPTTDKTEMLILMMYPVHSAYCQLTFGWGGPPVCSWSLGIQASGLLLLLDHTTSRNP